jgi:hypothetical protein
MKKVIVAILALLYLGTSTGATIHMHYCMGKLADWGLSHNDDKKCSKCGMLKLNKKDNGCCKDEDKFLKNDTDQKTTDLTIQQVQLISVALPAAFIEYIVVPFSSVTEENPISHAPPRNAGVAVYIRNCVFLI